MDRIETLREEAQALNGQFSGSLFRFLQPTEEKPDPRNLMKTYVECERKVALLQTAQATYNVRVTVEVLGETMLLQQAVKLIGCANRVKNNWLSASKNSPDNNNYSAYLDMVRDKSNDYAQRVVNVEECLRLSREAADFAAALKQAIRAGNAQEIEADIDSSLFE